MASSRTGSKTDDTPLSRKRATADEPRGTGQEPDPRGVHIPGSAPGQFTDLGPVSLPVDAPRVAR